MKLYAIGLLPLTQKLKATAEFVTNEREISQIRVNDKLKTDVETHSFEDQQLRNWSQFWYADDSSCITNLKCVLFWMKLLIREGPKYAYYPEPEKSYKVVSSKFTEVTNELFSPYRVTVTEE